MSTYRNNNLKGKSCCMDSTRSMTQCMSLHAYEQGFPNRDRVESPSMKGMGNFAWAKLWFWPFEPFSRPKTTFCKYWALIKIKIGLTCVHNESEVSPKNGAGATATAKNVVFSAL